MFSNLNANIYYKNSEFGNRKCLNFIKASKFDLIIIKGRFKNWAGLMFRFTGASGNAYYQLHKSKLIDWSVFKSHEADSATYFLNFSNSDMWSKSF
jgi:hypothetical protein